MRIFDIVLPRDNEEEFVDRAKRLGFFGLVILKEISSKKDLSLFRTIEDYDFPVYYGALVNIDDYKELRSILSELFYRIDLYNDLTFVVARDYEFTRKVIETHFHNGIVNPGFLKKEDHLHYRFTGISSIALDRLRKEKRHLIVYGVRDLLKEDYVWRSKYLGRILYLSRFINKWNIPISIGSFARSPEEILHPKILVAFKKYFNIKASVRDVFYENIIRQIVRSRKAKNPYVFTENFEIVKFPYEDSEDY